MKRLLLILILTLSFQSWTKADDIKDFEIEGMSIGDNLLDYFTLEQINKNEKFYYPNSKKFAGLSFAKQNFYKTFDAVQFTFKDTDYKIASIEGELYFKNDLDSCIKKKDQITNDLIDMFSNEVQVEYGTFKAHAFDKSGKSKSITVYFEFKNGDVVKVSCYDWAKNINFDNSLMLSIDPYEIRLFLSNEAYK